MIGLKLVILNSKYLGSPCLQTQVNGETWLLSESLAFARKCYLCWSKLGSSVTKVESRDGGATGGGSEYFVLPLPLLNNAKALAIGTRVKSRLIVYVFMGRSGVHVNRYN